MGSSVTNSDVLNSWKEVAAYLGRGVRTVQRWEQELGLPVRRPRGKTRSAVIAFRRELDQWLQHAPSESAAVAHPPVTNGTHAVTNGMAGSSRPTARLHDSTVQLITRTQQLLNRSIELCERMKDLETQLARAIHMTAIHPGRKSRMVSVKSSPPQSTTGQKPGPRELIAMESLGKYDVLAG